MAIIASEILIKASTTVGAAGNTTTQTVAGNNLGKYISTTVITDATLNNLFPDVTGDENSALNNDYQCIFIHNNNASLTFQNVVAWISNEVAGGVTTAIGVDPTAASAVGTASAQAVAVANKNTAPAGVAFTTAAVANSKATGVSVGNIPNGQVKAIWIRRTATNSAAQNNDGLTVSIQGDTAA